jgi:hypothetical protein
VRRSPARTAGCPDGEQQEDAEHPDRQLAGHPVHQREVPAPEQRERDQRLAVLPHLLDQQEHAEQHHPGRHDQRDGDERGDRAPVIALTLDQPVADGEQG